MPTEANIQVARREAILHILGEHAIAKQTQLVTLLRDTGHEATQSSVSRDLRELGVAKIGERYVAPLPTEPATIKGFERVAQFGWVRSILSAGPNLTVVHTAVGAAQSVGLAIDRAQWPELVGSISGDDTVFLATTNARTQQKLTTKLQAVFRP